MEKQIEAIVVYRVGLGFRFFWARSDCLYTKYYARRDSRAYVRGRRKPERNPIMHIRHLEMLA